ncbi:hypothetical protein AAMO2058_000345000 [Amorphochlora amoebiformis]
MSDFSEKDMADLLKKKKERIARLKARKAERKKRLEEAKAAAQLRTDLEGADKNDVGSLVPEKPADAPTPVAAPVEESKKVLDSVTVLIGNKTNKKAEVKLGFAKGAFHHNLQPAQRVIKYDKGIQIELETPLEKTLKGQVENLKTKIAQHSIGVGPDEAKMKQMKEVKSIEEERAEELALKAKMLTKGERDNIMASEKFLKFFKSSTKIIERALTQNDEYDITIDYSKKEGKGDEKEEEMLKPGPSFADTLKTNQRAITSIKWSPKHKDLFLVSYAEHQNIMTNDPDGLVLVWSTHTPSRPEYALTCQSAVLVAIFHPSKPNVVIGGTKSGQVIVWDLSVKTTPTNRTSLSTGHTHPVYAIDCVPAVNKAYSILSVSTDGHVCIWTDIDHLEEPGSEINLTFVKGRTENKDRDITTTSFGFVGRDWNSLVLGSDEGVLYKARLYDVPNSPAGIHQLIPAHVAPITNVNFRPPIKGLPSVMSELFLTSSFDWTTKLWSTKSRKPLLVFERCRDYVYDTQWSPVHPAVFITGDGNGNLDVWNLNTDAELPANSTQACEKERTISKLAFSSNGLQIAVGSSSGTVRVFNLHEKLGLPQEDDAKKFYESMQARLKSATERPHSDADRRQGRYHGFSNQSSSITSILNTSGR